MVLCVGGDVVDVIVDHKPEVSLLVVLGDLLPAVFRVLLPEIRLPLLVLLGLLCVLDVADEPLVSDRDRVLGVPLLIKPVILFFIERE